MRTHVIRALDVADIPSLGQMNPSFLSDSELLLEKTVSDAQEITWHLVRRDLERPLSQCHGYDLKESDLPQIRNRVLSDNCLSLIAEDKHWIVGLLEVEPGNWRGVGWIWNILIDADHRGRGLGRSFVERAVAWARQHHLHALVARPRQTTSLGAASLRTWALSLEG